MIDPVWMAIALLAVSWATAGMVALDALIDARTWARRWREWRATLVMGMAQTALGRLSIEQRARTLDDGGIGFFERHHTSTVFDGRAQVGQETLELTPAPDAEVWVPFEALVERAQCPSPSEFHRLSDAARGKGALRTVEVEVQAGQRVWVAGKRDGSRLAASLVSSTDPWVEARRRLLLNAGLILLDVSWATAGTLLALWPPAFGTVSIVGACVLVAHFLGITPLAMKVRDLSRTPARRPLLGEWKAPTPEVSPAARA